MLVRPFYNESNDETAKIFFKVHFPRGMQGHNCGLVSDLKVVFGINVLCHSSELNGNFIRPSDISPFPLIWSLVIDTLVKLLEGDRIFTQEIYG